MTAAPTPTQPAPASNARAGPPASTASPDSDAPSATPATTDDWVQDCASVWVPGRPGRR
jgi:hypothetical protein